MRFDTPGAWLGFFRPAVQSLERKRDHRTLERIARNDVSDERRAAAIAALGRLRALDALKAFVEDDGIEPRLRLQAIQCIVDCEDSRASTVLASLRLREDEIALEARRAAQALMKVKALQSYEARPLKRPPNARQLLKDMQVALVRMSRTHDAAVSTATPFVVAAASGNPDLRQAAVYAVRGIDTDWARQILLSALDDAASAVRDEAITALGESNPDATRPLMIAALDDRRARVRNGAIAVLGMAKHTAVAPAVLELLGRNKRLTLAALETLRRIRGEEGEEYVDRVVGYLRSHDAQIRAAAVRAIGASVGMPSDVLLRTTLSGLEDPELGVRVAAIELARDHKIANATDLLSRLMVSDLMAAERAAIALGAIGGEDALAALLAACTHGNEVVRLAAVRGLALSGSTRAIRGLLVALSDSAADVRRVSIDSLGSTIHRSAVVSPVIELLKHHDAHVRQAAIEILGRIRDGSAFPALLQLHDRRPTEATEQLEHAIIHCAEDYHGRLWASASCCSHPERRRFCWRVEICAVCGGRLGCTHCRRIRRGNGEYCADCGECLGVD